MLYEVETEGVVVLVLCLAGMEVVVWVLYLEGMVVVVVLYRVETEEEVALVPYLVEMEVVIVESEDVVLCPVGMEVVDIFQ